MNLRKTRSQTAAASGNNQANHTNTGAPPTVLQSNYVDSALFKECEDMINLLRVVELQKILAFVNISFAGRKQDLQRRILGLLRNNFELIAPKVKEVYHQSLAENQSVQQQFPTPTDPTMYSHMQMPVQANAGARLVNSGVPPQAISSTIVPRSAADAAAVAAAAAGNVNPFLHQISAAMPLHPDVRLKKLAFYDVLDTLLKPSSLLPRNTQRIQETEFIFSLSPQQSTEIAMNRDIRNPARVEYVTQVQLRFCLMETSCDQDDCFPPSVSVKVNNKLCQLPNVIPTNRPNVEPKRPPRPVNITSNVKLSPTVQNVITVQWCPDYTRGYCLAVYLVQKLSSEKLLQRLKTKGIKPADYTRALIKEKLTEDADCEIATTMLKVSLNCPLGKMKMSIPCRASTCSHLQCFDASLFLQMNERKPTWNCPVCDKPAVYDTLVIDGYFQEVLASPVLKPDDTEIQLHKDGSWSTHSLRNEAQFVDTPTKPAEKVEIVSDDLEVIDIKPTKIALPTPAQDQPTSTTNNETVDLTLSDSDDDMPLAKRRPAPAATKQNVVASSNTHANNVTSNMNDEEMHQMPIIPDDNVIEHSQNDIDATTSATAINKRFYDYNTSDSEPNLENANDTVTITLDDTPSPPSSPIEPLSSVVVSSTNDTPKSHFVDKKSKK